MYHDRTAWRCAFFVSKNMDAAKDIDKEMLPIWAAFLCRILRAKKSSARLPSEGK
jgi:hypothetical protein